MNRVNVFIACLLCHISLLLGENGKELPEPYNSIELLPFDPHGWYTNAQQLEALIKNHSIHTIIEVGSWLGQSTRHMASLLPEGGIIYAIDHWEGSLEHIQGLEKEKLSTLYQQFLSNVIHEKLTDKIIPIKMNSLDAAKYMRQKKIFPDLIYIDASHDTKSVYKDLNAWYPFVKNHGILCGDDWMWESVKSAVRIFAYQHKLFIQSSGNFWCLY